MEDGKYKALYWLAEGNIEEIVSSLEKEFKLRTQTIEQFKELGETIKKLERFRDDLPGYSGITSFYRKYTDCALTSETIDSFKKDSDAFINKMNGVD